MASDKDIRIRDVALYFIPAKTRIPLKFGPETTTHAACARVRVTTETGDGRIAEGWGETPLSVAWVWPSTLPYDLRLEALKDFTRRLLTLWRSYREAGHAMEIGHLFATEVLPGAIDEFNRGRSGQDPLPHLAGLVCCSPFDIALHDAYGNVHGVPTYETYDGNYMNHDLAWYYTSDYRSVFSGRYPADFFSRPVPGSLRAWHLVGGKDLLDPACLTGTEPRDGYPVLLRDWIARDGLKCLKVKLTGDDPKWDYDRLVAVGRIAIETGVEWLSADFNCTVRDPAYVNAILDRLLAEQPRIYALVLYIEQPFPYDLEANRIDVHSVSARKPLFMDESAHDWRYLALGRTLGWTGVALKTCKTQTGALLSLSWAKTHGMTIMVQDLTTPMLAQISHVQLAAHAGTIMGVDTNAMQFYPEVSGPEAAVHPGLYTRRNGRVDLGTLGTTGFGYRVAEIERKLPEPEKGL